MERRQALELMLGMLRRRSQTPGGNIPKKFINNVFKKEPELYNQNMKNRGFIQIGKNLWYLSRNKVEKTAGGRFNNVLHVRNQGNLKYLQLPGWNRQVSGKNRNAMNTLMYHISEKPQKFLREKNYIKIMNALGRLSKNVSQRNIGTPRSRPRSRRR